MYFTPEAVFILGYYMNLEKVIQLAKQNKIIQLFVPAPAQSKCQAIGICVNSFIND